ncbi:MAG: DUF4465 domain-containing protein [Bacteroidales bacterium]
MKTKLFFPAVLLLMLLLIACEKEKFAIDIVDFEELMLDASGYWNGSDESEGFSTGNIFFVNHYDKTYQSWSGFAYTNHSDTVTGDYSNQYSSITGSGDGNSAKYGVFYYSGLPDTLVFEIPEKITGIALCNSTYVYKSIKNGTPFSKKFGGDSGNDPDWLKVTLTPIDSQGIELGYMDVFLADFRFTDNKYDYIANAWTEIDLSQFGFIKWLKMEMSSSDSGEWGMNTPAYVCIDNIKGVLEKEK